MLQRDWMVSMPAIQASQPSSPRVAVRASMSCCRFPSAMITARPSTGLSKLYYPLALSGPASPHLPLDVGVRYICTLQF